MILINLFFALFQPNLNISWEIIEKIHFYHYLRLVMIDYHHYLSILLIGYSKNFLLKLVNLSEFAISSEHIKLLEVYRLLSKFLRNNNIPRKISFKI